MPQRSFFLLLGFDRYLEQEGRGRKSGGGQVGRREFCISRRDFKGTDLMGPGLAVPLPLSVRLSALPLPSLGRGDGRGGGLKAGFDDEAGARGVCRTESS